MKKFFALICAAVLKLSFAFGCAAAANSASGEEHIKGFSGKVELEK